MGKKIKNIRHWFQACFFALTNGYVQGFLKGKIYTGSNKGLCVPGLNCYSCPGAFGSCPIGSLQAVMDSRKFNFSCYVFGIIMAFGALFGRLICGWMCPFGMVQDFLYKIPIMKKIKNLPGHKILSYLKYVILALFVIILPVFVLDIVGNGQPWFCEYICPSGTLIAGIPLVILDKGLRAAIGLRFWWKIFILVLILILSIKAYRPFCKYLCPLGALYGFCNPISFYHFQVNQDACIKCGACQKACGMDIKVWEKPNSMECIRCGKCKDVCPNHAITSSWEIIQSKMLEKCAKNEEASCTENYDVKSEEKKWTGKRFAGFIMALCFIPAVLGQVLFLVQLGLGYLFHEDTNLLLSFGITVIILLLVVCSIIFYIMVFRMIQSYKRKGKEKSDLAFLRTGMILGLFLTVVSIILIPVILSQTILFIAMESLLVLVEYIIFYLICKLLFHEKKKKI